MWAYVCVCVCVCHLPLLIELTIISDDIVSDDLGRLGIAPWDSLLISSGTSSSPDESVLYKGLFFHNDSEGGGDGVEMVT